MSTLGALLRRRAAHCAAARPRIGRLGFLTVAGVIIRGQFVDGLTEFAHGEWTDAAAAYARYIYWFHFAEGSLMSLLILALVIGRVPEANASPVRTRVLERMKQTLFFIDSELAQATYFAGSAFTAADVMMTFPFTTMRHFLNYDLAPYANILAYLQRIESRPAYQKAMALAGPKEK